jgi:hypothetical protein
MSELRFDREAQSINSYEVTLNELIKKEPVRASDSLAFSINQFTVEMISADDYMELI